MPVDKNPYERTFPFGFNDTPQRKIAMSMQPGSGMCDAWADPTAIINNRDVVEMGAIKDHVRRLHGSRDHIGDEVLDGLLFETPPQHIEAGMVSGKPRVEIAQRHAGEELWLSGNRAIWTSYDVVRTMVQAAHITSRDVFYDLGSGYGRVPLYVGLATGAEARGIEILSERVTAAEQAATRLGLDNVRFTEGNVLDQDFSDGTVFYLYQPFSKETFGKVYHRLRALAAHKPITVITKSCPEMAEAPWLELQDRIHVGYSVVRVLTSHGTERES